MFLYLNTTSSEFIVLALADKEGRILKLKKIKAPYQQSEKLLTEIERLFNIQYPIFNIKGLIVVSGPGSFTSLRIGVATGNALAYALQIPIIGVACSYPPLLKKPARRIVGEREGARSFWSDELLIKKGIKKLAKIKRFKQILPKYGSEPNIGKK